MSMTQPQIISWPLSGLNEQGQLGFAENDESVREVMLNILLTRPGERLMRPEFGAGLMDFVHQPNNQTTRHLIADVVKKSLQQWEHRVVIEQVEVLAIPDNVSEVHINIRYHMRHTLRVQDLNLSLTLGQ